jgi:D-tyrosyl-tRNA(Tyr) deacylase
MRVVIQRVREGRVSVEGKVAAAIGRGLVILAAAAPEDTAEQADWLGAKCAHLRIFEDEAGKMNRSLVDVGGQALVVSQFTLYADTNKGRRPSFVGAAAPEEAEPLIERLAAAIRREGVETHMGVFGAHMLVEIDNDGPVTILMDRP